MKRIYLELSIIALLGFSLCISSCKKEDINDTDNDVDVVDNLPNITGYPIVETGVTDFYDNSSTISQPATGEAFYGQDANYTGTLPNYTDNGNGTITDNITGLMWQQSPTQMAWGDAASNASSCETGGHTDWRVPTIKEIYSLINFSGAQGTGDPSSITVPSDAVPFIDTNYFNFEYSGTQRYIDVQYITSTEYTGTALNSDETFFGLNLADGRIKAYPQSGNMSNTNYPAIFVRGNTSYGTNDYVDNGDGTITDNATGLMWCKYDSGEETPTGYTNQDGSLNWEEALDYSENLDYAGNTDWRLPNAKELHSILDYSRSPDATNSAAIDAVFGVTTITNELGQDDYPGFWSSTSFVTPSSDAILIYFGRAMGYLNNEFLDVHGAGCQRTDPKEGTPDYGHGPQGDVRRIYNYVRCVRDAN